MFDKLEDLLIRFEEIMGELHEPTVTNNQERFRKLMKEQSDLTPIVDAYTEYKKCKQDIEDSLSMLEEEKDEEMREMIKETLNDSKKRVEELEQELKILLLPKDPNDDKNVIVEIRAGAGGDEAALFAAEIYRMYVHYAEKQRWKVELINVDEIGIGGMKEVQFTISGQGAYSKMKYESGFIVYSVYLRPKAADVSIPPPSVWRLCRRWMMILISSSRTKISVSMS